MWMRKSLREVIYRCLLCIYIYELLSQYGVAFFSGRRRRCRTSKNFLSKEVESRVVLVRISKHCVCLPEQINLLNRQLKRLFSILQMCRTMEEKTTKINNTEKRKRRNLGIEWKNSRLSCPFQHSTTWQIFWRRFSPSLLVILLAYSLYNVWEWKPTRTTADDMRSLVNEAVKNGRRGELLNEN